MGWGVVTLRPSIQPPVSALNGFIWGSLSIAPDHVASVILLSLSFQNCVDIFHMQFSPFILFVLMGFCLLFANLFSLVDYCFGKKVEISTCHTFNT